MAGPSDAKDSWQLVVAVTAASTIGTIPATLTGFLLGGLVDDRGFSAVEAGWMSTVEMTAVAGTAILAAPFMARLSVVPVAFCGASLALVAEFASTGIASFWLLAAARFATGIGAGLVLAAATAAAAAARDPDRLYGYVTSALMLLLGLSVAGIGLVIERWGITGGYTLLGLVFLTLMPVLGWLAHAPRKRALAVASGKLPRRPLAVLLAGTLVLGLGPGPTFALIERFGVNLGLTVERVGLFYSIAIVCGVAGCALAARSAGRWKRSRLISLGLFATGITCLSLGYTGSELGYFVSIVLCWTTYMFVYTFLLATAAVFDPSGRVGPAAIGSLMIVLGLGPTLGGFLVTWGSYLLIGWFALAICGLGALAVGLTGRSLDLATAPPIPPGSA